MQLIHLCFTIADKIKQASEKVEEIAVCVAQNTMKQNYKDALYFFEKAEDCKGTAEEIKDFLERRS